MARSTMVPTCPDAGDTADASRSSTGEAEPVTLVVPVRDEEATLPSLLRSIEAQTRAPDAVVFVDAGSQDGSRLLLADACSFHAGWRVLPIGPATPGRARDAGIAAAATELVALADAGTELDAHWLERLTRRARPGVEVVRGHVEPSVTDPFAEAAALVLLAPPERTREGPIRPGHVQSILIRRELWRQVGGFPDLRATEDRLFVRRILQVAASVAHAPEAVVHWQMADTFAATFARFRLYAKVNVEAGEQGDWHHGVARMYLASVPFWLLAATGHRSWGAIPLAGFAARVLRNIWQRRAGRGLAWALHPARCLRVAAITLTVDAATFAGWIDAALARPGRA